MYEPILLDIDHCEYEDDKVQPNHLARLHEGGKEEYWLQCIVKSIS